MLFKVVYFGLKILESKPTHLRSDVYMLGLSLFAHSPLWTGSLKATHILDSILSKLHALKEETCEVHALLTTLVENEMDRVAIWHNPIKPSGPRANLILQTDMLRLLRVAWSVDARVAYQLCRRFTAGEELDRGFERLMRSEPHDVLGLDACAAAFIADAAEPELRVSASSPSHSKLLNYWTPVSPIVAVSFLATRACDPMVLQYAMRSIAHFAVDQVFFYIPQIVQALRHDARGKK